MAAIEHLLPTHADGAALSRNVNLAQNSVGSN